MDKQAFKQRMQNLKSYRENNPGKGYWDWKVQAIIISPFYFYNYLFLNT